MPVFLLNTKKNFAKCKRFKCIKFNFCANLKFRIFFQNIATVMTNNILNTCFL